jgi:hypothetical protein
MWNNLFHTAKQMLACMAPNIKDNKMKYVLILSLMLLAGCEPTAKEKVWPVVPAGLQDCKFYRLTDTEGNAINIARCPLSATTAKTQAKNPVTTITVDGMEYVPK